jgi:hypothetical protein
MLSLPSAMSGRVQTVAWWRRDAYPSLLYAAGEVQCSINGSTNMCSLAHSQEHHRQLRTCIHAVTRGRQTEGADSVAPQPVKGGPHEYDRECKQGE